MNSQDQQRERFVREYKSHRAAGQGGSPGGPLPHTQPHSQPPSGRSSSDVVIGQPSPPGPGPDPMLPNTTPVKNTPFGPKPG